MSVIQPRVLLYEYFPSRLTYHVLLLRYKLQVSWLFIFLICVSLSVLPSNASFPSYPQLWFDYVLQPHLPLCLHPLSDHAEIQPSCTTLSVCLSYQLLQVHLVNSWTMLSGETVRLSALFLLSSHSRFQIKSYLQLCSQTSAVASFSDLHPVPGFYTVLESTPSFDPSYGTPTSSYFFMSAPNT